MPTYSTSGIVNVSKVGLKTRSCPIKYMSTTLLPTIRIFWFQAALGFETTAMGNRPQTSHDTPLFVSRHRNIETSQHLSRGNPHLNPLTRGSGRCKNAGQKQTAGRHAACHGERASRGSRQLPAPGKKSMRHEKRPDRGAPGFSIFIA